MAKKYIVRDGFVVLLAVTLTGGKTSERTYNGGEEVTLEDTDAALHAHKLEYALQKDRDAALVAEKQADIAAKATQNPAELIGMLVSALTQAQAQAAAVEAPAA